MGLRGIAALLVVFHHLYLREHLDIPYVNTLAMRGYLAVDLFFVLSGFVMALSYGAWFTGQWRLREYAEFLKRRVARLWPLHSAVVLAVLAYVTLNDPGSHAFWPKMIASNLLMLQSWGWSQVIVPPSWSVSTELLAYVLFPALAAMALHGRPATAWVTASLAAAALIACMMMAPDRGAGRRGVLDIYDNWSLLPAGRCVAGFTFGLLAFRALATPWILSLARRPLSALVTVLVVTVALMGGAPDLAAYAVFPILIVTIFAGDGQVQRALSAPPLYQTGVLSFAIYLVHYPVLEFLLRQAGTRTSVLVPLFLLCTAAAAAAAHWWIELPGQRMLRRLRTPFGLSRAGAN